MEDLRTHLKSNKLFNNLFDKDIYDIIERNWADKKRHYHSLTNHLLPMLSRIRESHIKKSIKDELEVVAVFHDIIYDPDSNTNEEDSAELFRSKVSMYDRRISIYHAILGTGFYVNSCWYKKYNRLSEGLLSKFAMFDLEPLLKGSFADLIKNEYLLFKEYQYLPYAHYKTKRLEFLNKFKECYNVNNQYLAYIEYMETFKPKIGIYAGSFDPFHKGHYDILEKSEKIFDKVIVAKGKNPDKPDHGFDIPNLDGRQVSYYTGFLTDFVKEQSVDCNVTIIRGLRTKDEIDEMNLYKFIQDLRPEINVVWIPCNREYEHISSSALRSMYRIEPDSIKNYII